MKYSRLKRALWIGRNVNIVNIVLEGLKGRPLDEICSKYKIDRSVYRVLLKEFIEGGRERLKNFNPEVVMGYGNLKRIIDFHEMEIKSLELFVNDQLKRIEMLERKLKLYDGCGSESGKVNGVLFGGNRNLSKTLWLGVEFGIKKLQQFIGFCLEYRDRVFHFLCLGPSTWSMRLISKIATD